MFDVFENWTDWCTLFLGQLGARSGIKMLRVQGRGKKKFSRAMESAQFRCSRHSELSGEPYGGRRGGREQRHFSW